MEADSGIVLGPYFPHHTWLLCADRATAADVARLDGVAWVGHRPPGHKLAEGLDVVMQAAAVASRYPSRNCMCALENVTLLNFQRFPVYFLVYLSLKMIFRLKNILSINRVEPRLAYALFRIFNTSQWPPS